MPVLIIGEKKLDIPGLGKTKQLADLSPKRITKAVREKLRSTYGRECVACSCGAEFIFGTWKGQCRIKGQEYAFRIEEDDD